MIIYAVIIYKSTVDSPAVIRQYIPSPWTFLPSLSAFISLLYLDTDEVGRSSVSSCPIMTSPGCPYAPFALNSPAALSRQRASREHRHYLPASPDYSSTATRRTLRARVCTRTRSEVVPSTETVFATRWTRSSLLSDSVRTLISVRRYPDYL